MRAFAIALAILAGGSLSGCKPARSLQQFPRPVFATFHMWGYCWGGIAVDHEGEVWAERRCDSGGVYLRPTGRSVTSAERTRIELAFAALPPERGCFDDQSETSLGERVHLVRPDGAGQKTWGGCLDGDDLAPPFAEADAALNAVGPWEVPLGYTKYAKERASPPAPVAAPPGAH